MSSGMVGQRTFYVHPMYFCDDHHTVVTVAEERAAGSRQLGIVSKWRQKERLKTTVVAMVLCLNIGVDPPDVTKVSPCAVLECGVDPFATQPQKALDAIGRGLQGQYERWQPKAKYKLALDPTVDDVKRLCMSCRRNARSERVLFHYNGHGVPKPTANGELWVFNKSFTQYIPLSIYDLQMWLGTPAIYVLDCSAAGQIVQAYQAFAHQRHLDMHSIPAPGDSMTAAAAMRDSILLAACQADGVLPQAPGLPADLFTSCLTVPIKIALQWLLSRGLLADDPRLTPETIDRIPGSQTDRKTPLGELNWIFTAITDSIAWNMLPRPLFQKLFRQDLLVASLFRNFLLAERILRANGCRPVSYPVLPQTHHHHMWDAWDHAAELCLVQVPGLLADSSATFQQSTFFTDQLTAFEIWLDHGAEDKQPPEQLPVVLQVLLSQQHRLKALVLLGRFIDKGPWAVELALSVGIFPYILKLLQTNSTELHEILVFLWAKILALDSSCQADLVKDNGHLYFVRFLDSRDWGANADARAMAAFALAVICESHPKGQALAAGSNLLSVCMSHFNFAWQAASSGSPLLLKWLCLCMGMLWDGMNEVSAIAITQGVVRMLLGMLQASSPEVRACAIFALGTLLRGVSAGPDAAAGAAPHAATSTTGMTEAGRMEHERGIVSEVIEYGALYDGSALVRAETATVLVRLVHGHHSHCHTARDQFLAQQGSDGSRRRQDSLRGRNSLVMTGEMPLGTSPSGSPPAGGGGATGGTTNGDAGGVEPLEGFYVRVLEALAMLASDPSPRVAEIAKVGLSALGMEVQGGAAGVGASPAAPEGSEATAVGARSGSPAVGPPGAHTPPRAAAVPVGPQRGLFGQSRSWRLFGSSADSSPTVAASVAASSVAGSPGGFYGTPGWARVVASAAANGKAEGGTPTPPSQIYSLECDHFRRPLLNPQWTSDVFVRGADGSACRVAQWSKVPDPVRQQQRQTQWLARADACRSQAAFSRLSHKVTALDLGGEACAGAVFLPFSDHLVLAGSRGTCVVYGDRGRGPVVNAFDLRGHRRGAGPPAYLASSDMFLVNRFEDPLVLIGSSDGAMRVWRNPAGSGEQQLAATWRAASLPATGAGGGETGLSYAWSHGLSSAFATAGVLSSTVLRWDVQSEMCFDHLQVGAGLAGGPPPGVTCLATNTTSDFLLACGCADGTVAVFDLRTSSRTPAIEIPQGGTKGVGAVLSIAFEPAGFLGRMFACRSPSEVSLVDLRLPASRSVSARSLSRGPSAKEQPADDARSGSGDPDAGGAGVVKEWSAHTQGSLVGMAGHPSAPLVATSSSSRVVKLWDVHGTQVGALQGAGAPKKVAGGAAHVAARRGGGRGTLVFHPLSTELAMGTPGEAGAHLISMTQ